MANPKLTFEREEDDGLAAVALVGEIRRDSGSGVYGPVIRHASDGDGEGPVDEDRGSHPER
jgi:hypothetical protein